MTCHDILSSPDRVILTVHCLRYADDIVWSQSACNTFDAKIDNAIIQI